MMRQVVISGYYGFDNLGDEAVLGGLLAGLRAELPDVTPVVLSANPARTQELHGVAAVPRMNMHALREALVETDLLISGGGSLLQDVTSFRSPWYYLGVLWFAQREGVPTMLVGQGVGPLRHPFTRLMARRILNRTYSITVRDAASADYLRALGVDHPPLEVTADLSLLLEATWTARLDAWWAQHIPPGRPVIGVALRPWRKGRSAQHFHAISEALATLAAETGALLLFLPMQPAEDLPAAEAVAGWTPAESRTLTVPVTPTEMLAVIGRCSFVLAMRLHALIFAAHQRVPALGLAYDPKVMDFSRAAGLPTPPQWEDLTDEALTAEVRDAWESREAIRREMTAAAPRLTTLARGNLMRLREVLAVG
jgi:polysaccharide pyruvyl transferase CsaB